MSDIIEGREPVIEALKSGRPINKILLARTVGRHSTIGQILYLARERGIPVEFVEKNVIEQVTVTPVNQGVIAYAAMKEYVTLDDLMIISKAKNEKPFYCILDGIEDPYNLGAILRSADATGIHGVVIRERRAVGLTASVAKASAGAVEYVPVARVTNISQSIETLKKNNIWVIGLDQGSKTEFNQIDFTMPTAIVIGGEGAGLSDIVKKRCDAVVSIPMCGKIASLNASVAAALVMYEAFRQRREKIKL
jgi:23S rRNA (guanosine2251-2'-O)-methyltransferase